MAVDKLVDSSQLDADLTTVANAIRTKGGTSTPLAFPSGFAQAIADLPSGGGGASNVVTGTFKGTTTGAAMDISLPYTGSGYPIAVMIFPSEGSYGSGTFRNLIQRYAIDTVFCIKRDANTAPTYSGSGTENGYDFGYSYKGSSSNTTSIIGSFSGGSSGAITVANDNNATGSTSGCMRLRAKNKMSVYIASTSYGFAANIEYTYYVIYSS